MFFLQLLNHPQPKDSLAIAITEHVHKLSTMSWQDILHSIVDNLLRWGFKLLLAIVIYIAGKWLINRLRAFLKKILSRRSFDHSLSGFIISFINISLTVLLFIIVVGVLGVPTSTFTALVAAGGLAVGLALSGTLQNFAGGVMILLFKPFKVGDYIDANNYSGTVEVIKITTTNVITPDNKVVVIPNGALSNGNIVNYSEKGIRRIDWKISISYGDDIDVARETILTLLASDKRVHQEPVAPYIAVSELADSCVTILVRVWCDASDYWPLLYDVNELIYKELPKKGINFPFPQMEVSIKQ